MKANRKFVSDIRQDESAMLFNMLIGAGMAIVLLFAIFNIGSYINGTISSALIDSYGAAATRTSQENNTVNTLENISAGYDDVIDIMVIATIIMAITLPLAAVVAVKKLF